MRGGSMYILPRLRPGSSHVLNSLNRKQTVAKETGLVEAAQ